MRILVTGATGFVGRALIARLVAEPRFAVRATGRRNSAELPSTIEYVRIADLGPDTSWAEALSQVEVVVHLAARAHVMRERAVDPVAEYHRANVAGTLNLACQSAAAGVKRFVFMSSIKVNGESGSYTEADAPVPKDAYGISKRDAEDGLRDIATKTGLEFAIVRAPLVYGPGVKANFRTLMLAVASGMPLPVGSVDNRRSLIALDNLVDFVVTCIEHPRATNETFLVSDGEDLSTSDLIRRMARAMGRSARLIQIPTSVLMVGATFVGKRNVARRLLESLRASTSKAHVVLGWSAPISVDEGLRRAVAAL